MDNITGYYKSLKVKISFDDTKVKLGTKIINYDKIYLIKEDYITNYLRIIPLTLIAFGMIAAFVVSLLVLQTINIFIIIGGAAIGLLLGYFAVPKMLIDKYQNSYLKIVDIIYENGHDSFVVKVDEEIPLDKINSKDKENLTKYLSNIKKSRRYLVKELEGNADINYNDILKNLDRNARANGEISQPFGKKTIEVLAKSYNSSVDMYVHFAKSAARYLLVMVVIVVALLLITRLLGYHNFF